MTSFDLQRNPLLFRVKGLLEGCKMNSHRPYLTNHLYGHIPSLRTTFLCVWLKTGCIAFKHTEWPQMTLGSKLAVRWPVASMWRHNKTQHCLCRRPRDTIFKAIMKIPSQSQGKKNTMQFYGCHVPIGAKGLKNMWPSCLDAPCQMLWKDPFSLALNWKLWRFPPDGFPGIY